jgi:hypothetical protein
MPAQRGDGGVLIVHPLTRYQLATARLQDRLGPVPMQAPGSWLDLWRRFARLSPTAAG